MRSVEVLETTVLPPEPESCRLARDAVRDLCVRAHPPVAMPDVDIVVLLTSELVANAVVHTGEALVLAATISGDVARVTVADQSSRLPRAASAVSLSASGGRGLVLVEQLASRWGATPVPRHGKTVWFELDLG